MIIVMVLLAGALGAVLRYAVTTVVSVPWGVLTVNAVGSAIGGAVLGLADAGGVSSDIRLILLTGLCGGLTTFSTWTVEGVQLMLEGRWRVATASIVSNLVVGVGFAAAAWTIVGLVA